MVLFYNVIFAQEASNMSLEISKTILENSFFERYRFDIGTSYNHIMMNKFYIGGSLNITYSKLYGDNNTKTFIIKPRINIAYLLNSNSILSFIPKLGLGYSIICMNNKNYDFTDYQQGINGFLELKAIYNTKIRLDPYFVVSYDYIYLKKDEGFSQLNYFRNIHLINFGIGAKYKFYKNDE